MERKATVFYKAGELSYSFPFLYLSKSFVKVKYISATGTTYLTYAKDYSVEDKKVVLKVAGSTDNTICIYRETPTDSQVTFVDASVLRAYDMNQQEVQLLHIAEETADNMIVNGMTFDETISAWQGNNRRISNVAEPTEAQDAVTLHYMNSVGIAHQDTIVEAEKVIEAAKLAVAVSETNAKVSETNAKVSETNAKVSETNCSTMQDKVTTDTTTCESAANFASSMAVMTNNPINVGTYHADHSFAWYLANNHLLSTDAAKSAENAKTSETNAAASATKATEHSISLSDIIAAYPVHYKRNEKWTGDKTTVTSPSYLEVNIGGKGYILKSTKTLSINTADSWDTSSQTYITAANRAGKDFYVYMCQSSDESPIIILSANSTLPAGYTETTSRKIGGFHCLCADVGTISGHALSGYVVGDVLPASVWDLLHRPKCDPEGMAYNAGTDMWNMIYLASWTGTTAANTLKLVSKYGAVTADGASTEKFHWYKFADTMSQQNMRHPWHREFMAYARGSNQGTNIKGSADANTTGGHVDTAGRRMISNDGLEDCCGFLWQWIEDTGSASTGSWAGAYDANDFSDIRGLSYTTPYKGLAGGDWSDSSYCGSRCSNWSNGALALYGALGARGASEPRKGVM